MSFHSNTRALDKKSSMFRTHNKGTESEYTEYYVYLLEAKVVLHEKIQALKKSIMDKHEGIIQKEEQKLELDAIFSKHNSDELNL